MSEIKSPHKHCRLSPSDPAYRYPVSTNPYASKNEQLNGLVFSDNDTETHRGRWREKFRDSSPAGQAGQRRALHVELGCNAGHVVVEWAAKNPSIAYIGLDWKFKPIFWAAEKAIKRKIDNVLFFRAHAERLEYMFGPGEIDALYLFFPDPWPKKKQMKNRFITADQFNRIAKVVRPGGLFHIKTDHRGYFDWMLEAYAAAAPQWRVLEQTFDLHKDHPAPQTLKIPDVTLFERLFIKDGIKINSLKLERI